MFAAQLWIYFRHNSFLKEEPIPQKKIITIIHPLKLSLYFLRNLYNLPLCIILSHMTSLDLPINQALLNIILGHRRKKSSTNPTPQKYCSDRCRRERPRPAPSQSSLPSAYSSHNDPPNTPSAKTTTTTTTTTIEQQIEETFVNLLGDGTRESKGRIVLCGDVERILFHKPNHDRNLKYDPSAAAARQGGTSRDDDDSEENKTDDSSNERRGLSNGNDKDNDDDDDDDENDSEEDSNDEDTETDHDERGGVPITIPASSTTTTTSPSQHQQQQQQQAAKNPHQAGLQRARQREKVRQAARRGVAFGFATTTPNPPNPPNPPLSLQSEHGNNSEKGGKPATDVLAEDGEMNSSTTRGRRRKVEAVQGGRVVESSFAKGEWGVRWVGM